MRLFVGSLCLLMCGITASLSQNILPAESALSLDPLLSLVGCLRDSRPGYCLQQRAMGYFESWLSTSDEKDEELETSSTDAEGALGERFPAQWKQIINVVAERLANYYGSDGGGKDEENDGTKDEQGVRERNDIDGDSNFQVEDARGHKKKKIKAIKKAIIKLVIIALLIKHKLKMLLVAFQTFLQFKVAVLVSLLVVIHAIKLWVEIKNKHHPQKVIYYENAHHQHHYDDHHEHHDDDHHGWSLWGRKGLEASSPSIYGAWSDFTSYFQKRSSSGGDPSELAYRAYVPPSTPTSVFGQSDRV